MVTCMSNRKTEDNDNKENKIVASDKNNASAFYGSKLFLKFFFWFCLTVFITILVGSYYVYYFHYRPFRKDFVLMTSEVMNDNSLRQIEAYESSDKKDIEDYAGPSNFWVFNSSLEVLSDPVAKMDLGYSSQYPMFIGLINDDKPISEKSAENYDNKRIERINNNIKVFWKEHKDEIRSFARYLFETRNPSRISIGGYKVFGNWLVSANNNHYVAVSMIPLVKGWNYHQGYVTEKIVDTFLFLLIAATVFCIFLAKYLVRPIVELQKACKKFATGDFSQKINKDTVGRYDELGDLASDFNFMAEKIEADINSRKRLFNDISHELRSPLARMQVAVELLQLKVRDNEKSLVDRLGKDIERMNALISELLKFSKLENKETMANDDVDLGYSLKAVCEDAEFECKLNHKGVKLNIKQNSVIKGNADLIERAVENVVRNGLRFTPENTAVEVTLDRIENTAVITVEDLGPGVSEEEIEKIFAPFYCCSLERNPQKCGLGLGLSIAQRAIQLHNGNISACNRPSQGFKVSINLPLNKN